MNKEDLKLNSVPLMDVWCYAWYWMNKWGIPIEDWHKERIKIFSMPPNAMEPDKKSMASYITERCQNLKKEKIPDEFKPIIEEYKIKMMETWGWPKWGYEDVRHLRKEK